MTQKMTQAAREVANNRPAIESRFPNGFGVLATQLRDWRRIGS